MRRKALIVFLALGTIGGYASGFASMRCHSQRRAAFEQHVAQVCVDAARQSDAAARPQAQPPQQQPYATPVIVNVSPVPQAAPAAAPVAPPAQ